MKTLTNETINQAQSFPAMKVVHSRSIPLWVALVLIAGLPRILGAFLLPNTFWDAYDYLRDISAMIAKINGGVFSIGDLYGFWLPLYQFVCAAMGVVFGHPYYVAKLVSAVCGVGVCLFVFQISLRLTGRHWLAMATFLAVAINPLHIQYSASSMADMPHALLAIACLYFALKKRWKVAALFAAAAGLIRFDSWMLIALLPALQFIAEGRVSVTPFGISLVSPLLWLYLAWKVTGNPLAYFEARSRYLAEYIAADPALWTLSLRRLLHDLARLLTSTNLAVLAGCLTAAWMTAKRIYREGLSGASSKMFDVIAVNVFFLGYLGFLLLAYFTGNQPAIWSRYGLLSFVLGLPALAWTFQTITTKRPQTTKPLSIALAFIFILQTGFHLMEVLNGVSEESARKEVAVYLNDAYRSNPDIRFFCEDNNVRALSGVPAERLLDSSKLPADAASFITRLRQDHVEYLVTTSWEFSTLTKLFPELKQGMGNDHFQLVMRAGPKHSTLKLWVYRLR